MNIKFGVISLLLMSACATTGRFSGNIFDPYGYTKSEFDAMTMTDSQCFNDVSLVHFDFYDAYSKVEKLSQSSGRLEAYLKNKNISFEEAINDDKAMELAMEDDRRIVQLAAKEMVSNVKDQPHENMVKKYGELLNIYKKSDPLVLESYLEYLCNKNRAVKKELNPLVESVLKSCENKMLEVEKEEKSRKSVNSMADIIERKIYKKKRNRELTYECIEVKLN